MDTSNWTVEDHINWIREYAEGARTMAKTVVGWHLDALGLECGTVEVVPWPEVEPARRLRRSEREPEADPNTRVLHTTQGMLLVRDVA